MKKTLILSIMACLMIYGCKPGDQMHTAKSHEKHSSHEKHTGRSMHDDAHKHGQQKEPEDYVVKGSPEDFMITAGDRILFGYDSDQLSPEEKEVLDHQISWLLEHDHYDVKLEGHCDDRGTREYNIALGERRANTIKTYLLDRGISPKRIRQILSYGKDKPAVEGNNEEAWRLNRRVVIVLSKQ